MFFAISGYLIAQSAMRDSNVWRFASKRALRILPALWCLVAVTVFAGMLLTNLSPAEYWRHPQTTAYLSNAYLMINFVLPGVFPANPIPHIVNGSLWSLPAEVAMYIFAIVSLRFGWRGLAASTAIFAVFAFLPGDYRRFAVGPIYLDHMPSVGLFFIFSMWFAVLQKYIPLNWFQAILSFVLAVLSHQLLGQPVLTYFLLAYAVIGAGVSPSPIGRHLPDLSYGIFLYSYPIQQVLIQSGIKDPYTLMVCATPIVAIFAALSWYLIENPILKIKSYITAAANRGDEQPSEINSPHNLKGWPPSRASAR